MSWAIVVGAGVSLAGAYMNNQSASSAAKGKPTQLDKPLSRSFKRRRRHAEISHRGAELE
jgi:hypothetical protein